MASAFWTARSHATSLGRPAHAWLGYARDVRFDHPFDGYADPDVQKMHAATADTCDAFGRTAVRIQEVYDSIDMIETMLENCPSGPILTTDWGTTRTIRHRRHRSARGGRALGHARQ
ncbi:MAG: hypothetical protein ACLRM9_01065 [Collinsella aerofaciens]